MTEWRRRSALGRPSIAGSHLEMSPSVVPQVRGGGRGSGSQKAYVSNFKVALLRPCASELETLDIHHREQHRVLSVQQEMRAVPSTVTYLHTTTNTIGTTGYATLCDVCS